MNISKNRTYNFHELWLFSCFLITQDSLEILKPWIFFFYEFVYIFFNFDNMIAMI